MGLADTLPQGTEYRWDVGAAYLIKSANVVRVLATKSTSRTLIAAVCASLRLTLHLNLLR